MRIGIVNTDNEVIKNYLKSRDKLLKEGKKAAKNLSKIKFKGHLPLEVFLDIVESDAEKQLESLQLFDEYICYQKLGEDTYREVFEGRINLADGNYILCSYKRETIGYDDYTFEDKQEALDKLEGLGGKDSTYQLLKFKYKNKDIDKVLSLAKKKYERGSVIFVKADTIYSDNVGFAYT